MTDTPAARMLIEDEAQPAILRLWRALGRLGSTVTFMKSNRVRVSAFFARTERSASRMSARS